MRYTTKDLLSALIYKEHGWAVRDQFEDTYSDRDCFEKQNLNALDYIFDTVREALESELFSEDTDSDIKGYLYDLSEHLLKHDIEK